MKEMRMASVAGTLDIQVQSGSGAKDEPVVVRIVGDAGVTNVDALAQGLLPLAAMRPSVVIADLSELMFISSLAMSKLIELHRGLKQWNGELLLAVGEGDVSTALMRARLDAVLPCFQTVQEALQHAAGAR
jgi:anti-anti-sigma factor